MEMATAAKGKINKIYLHWTAGPYGHVYDDYHFCIDKDGTWQCPENRQALTEVLAHTWLRNTGAVGIAIEAARGAKLGRDGAICYGQKAPPTKKQVESMARAVAIICQAANIDINEANVMTHAEVADLDGYGPNDEDPDMRWDLYRLPGYSCVSGGDVVRQMANQELGVRS